MHKERRASARPGLAAASPSDGNAAPRTGGTSSVPSGHFGRQGRRPSTKKSYHVGLTNTRDGCAVRANFRRSKEHVMRATELERGEIKIEGRFQFLPVPGVTTEKLLVVGALLVPSRQQRARKIKPFPVPALRHHVYLLANLFLV